MNIAQVIDMAPPTPACFPDRLMWSEYLLSAQQSKIAVRPFDDRGVYRPTYNFCRECTQQHEAQMALAGKCQPNKFRADALNKELA